MEDKRVAVELWKAKVPLKRIREQLGMSEATLRRVLGHAKKHPSCPVKKRKPGSGKKKIISPETLRGMKHHLSVDPTLTARRLKAMMPGLSHCSIRVIQHHCLRTLKLPSRKMAAKPLLTQAMKDKRVAFALKYRDWGVDEWKKVMFSDESHFILKPSRRLTCRRSVGTDRFSPKFTRKTVKHPPKIMAWGCFSWKGRGSIEFLEKGEMMNGARYLRILDEKLEFFMGQHGTSHFLQDGAPCHKCKIVTSWFQARPHISLIDWPGNSPDLNPIENVWNWMKNKLQDSKATSLPQLKQEIKELWTLHMDDIQYLKNLVESMPRRLEAVILNEGNSTKY
jgi:transposase